jgi:hypothetical protein
MLVRLDTETWVIGKGDTNGGAEKGGMGEEIWRLLGFVGLMCVWVYFCCSGSCLCQGLQESGVCVQSVQ